MLKKIAFALCALLCLGTPSAEATELPFVVRRGPKLCVGKAPTALLGVNRYELAGGPQASQCQHWGGQQIWWQWATQIMDQTRAIGGNTIRMWAFQNFAGPSGKDFSAFDKVIAYAKSKNLRLWLVLGNQWGDCDQGGIKDANWFQNGYKGRYGYALSFTDYVQAIVSRYKDEPTIAVWEIINEGKLYEQPGLLKDFILATAKQIRSIDSQHLIAGGGGIQCWQGAQGAADFESYQQSSDLSIVTAHDYDDEKTAYPSCMAAASKAAKKFSKPFVIGESGIQASAFSGVERAALFDAKLKASAQNKDAGYLIWALNVANQPVADGFDFLKTDPMSMCLAKSRPLWAK